MITKQIKIYLYIGGAIAIAILIISGINLNVAASASAQATANSKAIATAVSQANALSVAVSSARASAINNTYFMNQRELRGLEWKVDVYYSEKWKIIICSIDDKEIVSYWFACWRGVRSVRIRPEIVNQYEKKPLPWMQRFWELQGTLYVGFFDKQKKK